MQEKNTEKNKEKNFILYFQLKKLQIILINFSKKISLKYFIDIILFYLKEISNKQNFTEYFFD